MLYLWLKTLHIVFVASWFAGLFYLPRIFVNLAAETDAKVQARLLGMAQRYGPYSFVVNTDKVSRATAEDQGWDLWNDPANDKKYGVLESDDWNVFNICCIAGFDPFKEHSAEEIAKFGEASVRRIYGDFSSPRLKSCQAAVPQRGPVIIGGKIQRFPSISARSAPIASPMPSTTQKPFATAYLTISTRKLPLCCQPATRPVC